MNITKHKRDFINKELFEELCGIQCTKSEIANFLKCSEDTILRWCKDTYGCDFATAYEIYSANGKISLRRSQMKMAEKNAQLSIWLGKQYLNQTDKIESNITAEPIKIISDMKKDK